MAQEDPERGRVKVHLIESIILGGSPFISSLFKPGTHRVTPAAIPLFSTDPVIVGEVVPPAVLVCDGGSFDSSPRGAVTYQWKNDTNDITDETSNTYTTVTDDIGANITCEVTVTNASGNDVVVSNGIDIVSADELSVFQMDIAVITGLSTPARCDVVSLHVYAINFE